MTTSPRTICVKCRHFLHISNSTDPDKKEPLIWYNCLCQASPSIPYIDPVSGLKAYANGQEYQFCRDVNDGECPKYVPNLFPLGEQQ